MEMAKCARDEHKEDLAILREEITERKGNITVINTEIAQLKKQRRVLDAD